MKETLVTWCWILKHFLCLFFKPPLRHMSIYSTIYRLTLFPNFFFKCILAWMEAALRPKPLDCDLTLHIQILTALHFLEKISHSMNRSDVVETEVGFSRQAKRTRFRIYYKLLPTSEINNGTEKWEYVILMEFSLWNAAGAS